MPRVAPSDASMFLQRSQAEPLHDVRVLLTGSFIFVALTLVFSLLSPGFLTADALIHFIFSKFAYAEPHYLTNVWGRPFCTALYAIPAVAGGRLAVRMTSTVLGLCCALVTYRIAVGQNLRWPVLAFVLTLGQPLLFLHSFSEMTELPFATLIAFAFWAYQRRRFATTAILIAFSPLARPEGFGFILLAVLAMLLHRRWLSLLLLPLGLVAWDVIGWLVAGREGTWWRWLPNAWPYSAESMYPRGSILQFVAFLPVVVSPIVLPAIIVGIALALRGKPERSTARAETTENDFHVRRCRIITAFVPLIVLTAHSVLYATGKLGSFGETRYMLVVAPFWGVLAARGWAWLWVRLGIQSSPVRWAAAAVLLPLPIALATRALPLRLSEDYRIAERAARWYQGAALRKDFPFVAASHPGVYYYLGISQTDQRVTADWTRETLRLKPPGTIIIWDPIYATRNASADRAFGLKELQGAGWIEEFDAETAINAGVNADTRWHVYLSGKPAAAAF